MLITRPQRSSPGFTLIELLVAITLSGIVVTIFVSTLMTMVRTAATQKIQLELSEETQIALNTVERDVRIALAFDTKVQYPTFTDSYGPTNTDNTWTGSWSFKGSDASDPDHRVLILRESATTTHPLAATRTPVYIDGANSAGNPYAEIDKNLNCTPYNASTAPLGALTYNAKLPYYLIYFVRDSKLYRRTLTDTTTPLCVTQYQKQSCPALDTTPPTTCKANDELIAENVASFTVAYNEQDYSSSLPAYDDIDAYAQADPDFSEISNIVVTLRLEKATGGSTRGTTLSIRVSRVN